MPSQRFEELIYEPYGRAVRPVSTDADFIGDEAVSVSVAVAVQDIIGFLAAWLAGSAGADVNADNVVTVQNITGYHAAWFAGRRVRQGSCYKASVP